MFGKYKWLRRISKCIIYSATQLIFGGSHLSSVIRLKSRAQNNFLKNLEGTK